MGYYKNLDIKERKIINQRKKEIEKKLNFLIGKNIEKLLEQDNLFTYLQIKWKEEYFTSS